MGKFRVKGLVKFGQREHLEALLHEGVIYMNNIEYFRKYEETQPKHMRGDQCECFDYICQNNTVKVFFEEYVWEADNVTMLANWGTYPGYLFCMYAAHADSNLQVDGRMLDFGEYAVIIQHPDEFIRRVQSYCAKNQITANCFPVQYYDEQTESGLLHPFKKRSQYSYQSEARIYIYEQNPHENMILRIGSICDIAIMKKCSRGSIMGVE